jgi:hypothetical protein
MHLPSRELDEIEQRAVAHGRPIALHSEIGPTRCLADGRLLCVAEPVATELWPKVVLEPNA